VKTSSHIIRLVRVLALAAVAVGTAVSVAQAGNQALDRGTPDTRDAAAVLSSQALPDAFERYVAAHPYGPALDRGTPDTRDAASKIASHFRNEDALYRAGRTLADRRPPDILDAAQTVRPVVFSQASGFDWSDYAIGIGSGIGLVLLFAGGLAGARQRRQPTLTA
jgi:hypothetical protein